MSLLERIFRGARSRNTPPAATATSTPTQQDQDDLNSYSYFTFHEHQVRVLLFRECEWKGGKILYDSSAIEKVPMKEGMETSKRKTSVHGMKFCENKDDKQSLPSIIEISEGFAFKYKANMHDSNLLGEMIFGSVAMNHRGMSLKFHILNDPKRLMCTKIFHSSNSRKFRRRVIQNLSARNSISSTNTESTCGCESTSVDSTGIHLKNSFVKPTSTIGSFGHPSDIVSRQSEDFLSVNWNLHKEDSGYSGDYSSNSSINSTNESISSIWNRNDLSENSNDLLYFENTPVQGDSSTNYLQRRLHRYFSTALEKNPSQNEAKPNLLVTMKNGDYNLAYSSIPSTSESLSSNFEALNSKSTKMAVAIVVTLSKNSEIEMFDFLMEHSLLLENALRRLRLAVQKACGEPHLFITNMSKATDETTQWLKDILAGPRLNTPLWTNLKISDPKCPDPLADLFLRDLCLLLKTMDTKDTYFFISTLLTNVLTYHLGWVNFVSPYNMLKQPRELQDLNIRKPYNPLWAQLGDLYGAIGSPARMSKTVIYGKESVSLVNKIIFVLSYFMRCSEMKRTTFNTSPISWESVDLCLTEINDSVNKPFKNCDNLDNIKSSDSIEMKTFSFKNVSLCLNKGSSDTLKSSSILHKTSAVEDLTEMRESKFIISNPTLPKCSKNLDLSSIDSTSTLVKSETEKSINNEVIQAFKESGTEEKPFNLDADEIKNKVNTLCRVPTSAVLYHMQSYANSSQTSINILPLSPKVECEKQQKSSIFYTGESFDSEKEASPDIKPSGVLFTLGEDDLVGLKKVDNDDQSSKTVEKNTIGEKIEVKSDTSSDENETDSKLSHMCRNSHCKHSKFNKHSGVKFEFDKYPQIVTNYLKSKNLEILDRHLIGKPGNLKIASFEFEAPPIINPFEENCEKCCSIYEQMLQTPSNASELEYTNDMPDQREIGTSKVYAVPKIVEPEEDVKDASEKNFIRKKLENTIIVDPIDVEKKDAKNFGNELIDQCEVKKDKINLPLSFASTKSQADDSKIGFNRSLMGCVTDHYISDLILQGTVCPEKNWECKIKRDLSLQNRNASGGAVCVLADIEDWSVKVYNSNGYMIGGMSALVATMLDSLPHMCHANVPTRQCLAYIESKLRELCIRSKTLAELLMDTEFCDMEHLTKTLNLDPNDVPLLLAIASTHSPQVSLKYGISFK